MYKQCKQMVFGVQTRRGRKKIIFETKQNKKEEKRVCVSELMGGGIVRNRQACCRLRARVQLVVNGQD